MQELWRFIRRGESKRDKAKREKRNAFVTHLMPVSILHTSTLYSSQPEVKHAHHAARPMKRQCITCAGVVREGDAAQRKMARRKLNGRSARLAVHRAQKRGVKASLEAKRVMSMVAKKKRERGCRKDGREGEGEHYG